MSRDARSFPALSRADARILILGSMPGIVSLDAQQYYAHPRNAFWPIMDSLLAPGKASVPDYGQRTQRLLDARIALWDVLQSCRRKGSLDSNIEKETEVANDFCAFFDRHREVELVLFNGAKAEQLYRRHGCDLPKRVSIARMPSTSPAHASMYFGQKLQAWGGALGRNAL